MPIGVNRCSLRTISEQISQIQGIADLVPEQPANTTAYQVVTESLSKYSSIVTPETALSS
jgi:hypothetical protein